MIADSGNMDPAELAKLKEQLKQRQQVKEQFSFYNALFVLFAPYPGYFLTDL